MADDTEEPWANDPLAESPEFTVSQTEAPWESDPIVSGEGQGTYRAAGYGPNAGDPPTHDTTYGPLGRLRENDIAVSPNMVGKFPLGSKADVVDPRTGKVVYQNQRVADYSYTSPRHPNYNEFEQRHVQDMGHMALRPSPTPWADDPIAGKSDIPQAPASISSRFDASDPTGEAARGTMAGEGPGTQGHPAAPSGDMVPWANDPIVKVGEQGPSAQTIASDKEFLNQEQAPTTNRTDVDTLAWRNLFGYGAQAAFGLDVAGYKEALNRAESGEPKPTLFGEQEEKDRQALANPNISQADAEEIIARRRAQTEMDQTIAQKQLAGAQANLEAAQKATPGPDYQRTIPGTVTRFIGRSAPFLMSPLLGAAGPFAMANQMSQQGYGETFDRTYAQGKEAHPDWTEEQLRQAADQAGRASAQTGFENGVVLGMLPIPKVGGLFTELISRVGLRGAYNVLAGASQDIEQNIQIKKVDPRQAIYDGVLAHAPANFTAGAAFEAPGAIGEAFRGPNAAPESAQERPETQPEAKAPAAPKKISSVDITPTKEGKWQLTVNGEPGDTFDTEDQALSERSRLLQPSIDRDENEPRYLSSESISYGPQGQSASGEKIVSAAVRVGDRVLTGANHPLILEDAPYELGMNPGDLPRTAEHGFVTSTGRFVDRLEAWKIANPNKEPPIFGMGSEDISEVKAPSEPQQAPEDTDKWVSAIANRYSQERSAQGEIGEIAPGEGYSREDLRQVGLRMKPEEINQHISDLMHDTGNPKLQAAAVAAEEARLSQRSARLSRISEDNPNDPQARANANDAFNDLTDFHNGPLAKLKNNWHAQGMTLQGEVPVDLGTFNGLREAWLRDVGTRINPSLEMKMRNTAARVRNAVAIEDMAMEKLGREIEKPTRQRLPSDEEVRNNIIERMKDQPCRI